MNVWPAALPQSSLRRGFTHALGDSRIRARTDAGGGTMRRRLSVIPEPVSVVMRMDHAQRVVFEAFVEDTLQGGVKPFLMPAQDGRGANVRWVVQIGERMPSFEPAGPDGVWQVTISLVRLPQ